MTREQDLYPPIKSFLEGQDYTVKAEINGCDVVAIRGDEPPVIVELKKGFTLDLVFQGVDRLRITDQVYLAVPAPPAKSRGPLSYRSRRRALKLCRRLGLGLILVHGNDKAADFVEVLLDPLPYRPRPNRRKYDLLLKEFAHRVGDPNTGGSTRRPIVTAYRQDALRCVHLLQQEGPLKVSLLRDMSGTARAAGILQKDVYGWFQRVERGIYTLSPKGREAAKTYADVIESLQ